MQLFLLVTPFTWIGSSSTFDEIHPRAKIIKRVKPEVRKLCAHLLNMGGERVVIPFVELGLCELLIDSGKVFSYKKLQIKKGEVRECHSNSATLWLASRTKYKIATGYGLSDDDIWRRHSWIMSTDNNLIETTIAHDIYFGIILNKRIARAFAESYTTDVYAAL
jgi:hypothetical protein